MRIDQSFWSLTSAEPPDCSGPVREAQSQNVYRPVQKSRAMPTLLVFKEMFLYHRLRRGCIPQAKLAQTNTKVSPLRPTPAGSQ
jgi:hypothetical protein